MKPLSELANEINTLRRSAPKANNNNNMIIEIFSNEIHSYYTAKEIAEKPFLVSDILMAFYKLKKYEKGLNFIDNYLKIDLSSLDYFTVNMYGWCVYKLIKEKFNDVENWDDDDSEQTNDDIDNSIDTDLLSFYNRIISIFNVLSIDNEKHYLVIKMLLFNFLKIISKQAKNQWPLGYELLTFFQPVSFSKETSTIKFKGKEKELASDFENWHAQKAKALFELEKYEECIIFSNEVLDNGILKHYDNDIWFKRRIALSEFKLKNFDSALSDMKEVIKIKKVWFVQKELAEIYYALGNYENALKYAIDSTLNRGELKFKWELYYLLYEILIKIDDIPNALLHLKFSASIRKKEGWKFGEKLTESLKRHNIIIENLDFELLKEEINEYANTKLNIGEIKNIIPHSKLGFINSKEGDIFFRFNIVEGNPSELKKGDKVYYSSDISFDKRKNRESVAAIYVSKITD